MTTSSQPDDDGILPTDIDPDQIFIAREWQIDLFEIYLGRWLKDVSLPMQGEQVVAPPSPDKRLQNLLVLLYGRGGFGKSTLLKRYHKLVKGYQNLLVSDIVNWEFAIGNGRSLFRIPQSTNVDSIKYFELLRSRLAEALGKHPEEFKEYQAAVKLVEEAKKQVSRAFENIKQDDHFAWARKIISEELLAAVRQFVPMTAPILSNDKIAGPLKEGIDSGLKFTSEQLGLLYVKLHDRVGRTFADYLEPERPLGFALGRDLERWSRNYPLLIFFDTYEEVDEADGLLRLVMAASGRRVCWSLAGRDNLWAGMEQRKRSLEKIYGYKEITLPNRALAVDFNAEGIGAFTTTDILEYFTQLTQKISRYAPQPSVTEEVAEQILEVTQGVPLAVRIAAELFLKTGDLETVTKRIEGKQEIVDEMVQRYLFHTHDDQQERSRLYGLALLRRPDNTSAVAAALELSLKQAETSYNAELRRLQQHYSFIFNEKGLPSLHQEVRYFLRLWLLKNCNEPEILAVNERLKKAHEMTLAELEKRYVNGDLRERLEDEEWVNVYLDLAEQQFWLSANEGVICILPFMLAAAIYQRDINEEAAYMGTFFETRISGSYLNWWQWANQSLTYTNSHNPGDKELAGLTNLAQLVNRRCPVFPPPLPPYQGELEAAMWWRMAEAYEGVETLKALEGYGKALPRLYPGTEIAAQTYLQLAHVFYNEKQYDRSLSLLDKAMGLKPDYAEAYNERGSVYADLNQREQAIADYTKALEIDQINTTAYYRRAEMYYKLKQYALSIEDYSSLLELYPRDISSYHDRASAYVSLHRYKEALDDYTKALNINPQSAHLYEDRATVYLKMKKYQQAIEDCEHAIKLARRSTRAFLFRGLTYLAQFNIEQAMKDFDYASTLEFRSPWSYASKGLLHIRRDEFEPAVANFTEAIAQESFNNKGESAESARHVLPLPWREAEGYRRS